MQVVVEVGEHKHLCEFQLNTQEMLCKRTCWYCAASFGEQMWCECAWRAWQYRISSGDARTTWTCGVGFATPRASRFQTVKQTWSNGVVWGRPVVASCLQERGLRFLSTLSPFAGYEHVVAVRKEVDGGSAPLQLVLCGILCSARTNQGAYKGVTKICASQFYFCSKYAMCTRRGSSCKKSWGNVSATPLQGKFEISQLCFDRSW